MYHVGIFIQQCEVRELMYYNVIHNLKIRIIHRQPANRTPGIIL